MTIARVKRIFTCISIIGVIALLVCSCQEQPQKYNGPVEKIVIGLQDNTMTALLCIAKGRGYFEEQSLDVELKKYQSGKLAFIGMMNGEADLCTVGDIPIMTNSFERNDYLVLSTIAYGDNALWIVARKDRGITKPEDLRGKKIATHKDAAAHFFMSMFLLSHQIPESKVSISYMQPADLPKALINGEIDAFSMRNPYVQEAKDALGDNAIEFFGPGMYQTTMNLVGKKDFVNEKPELIERVIRAVIKAEDFTRKNKEQSIQATAEQLGIERKKEVVADWNIYVFKVSLDQSLILTLEDEARWAIRNKSAIITEVPNYLNYIYLDALEKVKPAAVGIIHKSK